MSTPAGWYPDPTGRHQNRWFDGEDWTDSVADGQTVASDPVRGGAEPAAAEPAGFDPSATQVVPPQSQQPVAPTQPTAGTPPPGAPGAPSPPAVPRPPAHRSATTPAPPARPRVVARRPASSSASPW